jgi:GNAT superfamily N-acetyltransferase
MPVIIENHQNNLIISTDPARLDLDAIYEMLTHSYWANGRTMEMIERSIQNSLVFGIYDGPRQIGLARVISDYATFAWLCDVFIHEDYRGKGIGKWLIETVIAHPDLRELKRFVLATRDAHGLYAQYGFKALEAPERWMARING